MRDIVVQLQRDTETAFKVLAFDVQNSTPSAQCRLPIRVRGKTKSLRSMLGLKEVYVMDPLLASKTDPTCSYTYNFKPQPEYAERGFIG